MEFLKAIVQEPGFWDRTVNLTVLILAFLTILSLRGERNKAQKEVKELRQELAKSSEGVAQYAPSKMPDMLFASPECTTNKSRGVK